MKFPHNFYLTAITFISTSILVRSFGQSVLPNDPRIDGDPAKKLSRIPAVSDVLKIQNLKPSWKAPDNGITSDLGEPLSNVTPMENMATANTGQSPQASGDSAVDRHLILKRDIAADDAGDEEYMEHQESGSRNSRSDSSIHKRNSSRYRRDQSAQGKMQIYGVDTDQDAISVRLTPLRLVLDGVDSYTVLILKKGKEQSDRKTFPVSQELRCKLWDDALCLQNLSLKQLGKYDLSTSTMKVSGLNNGQIVIGKQWSDKLPPDFPFKDPSPPVHLRITQPNSGIAKFKWNHPWWPYTKIQGFRIEVTVMSTSLIESQKVVNVTMNHTGVPESREYESELQLYPSSTYHVEVTAENLKGFGRPARDNFTTPSSIDFASADISSVTCDENWIEFEVPAVTNATIHTWVTVTVEGSLKCTRNESTESPSTDQTVTRKSSVFAEYKVEKEAAPRRFKFPVNGTRDTNFTCYLRPGRRYVIKAKAKDTVTSESAVPIESMRITLPGGNGGHGEDEDDPPPEMENQPKLGWLVIIPIIVIVAILLLLILRYRKRTKSSAVSRRPSYLEVIPLTSRVAGGSGFPAVAGETNSVLQPNAEVGRTSAYLYSMPDEPDSWRVPVENFEEYVKNAVTSAQLNSQFKLLPRGSTKPSQYGRCLGNIRKNRSTNLIAYDDTRVILRRIPGDPYSDYINANYVRGFGKERAYIATQGPMSNTVEDFWRMVWQEDVRIVCMLTNVIEDGENKCVQYWPDIGAKVRYGDIVISNVEHQVFADFTFRSLELRYQQQSRAVSHLHYTGWPSHGIPTYPQSLTLYLKKLLKLPTGDGPVVVHCNTGDDRTGTIILCDICLREVVWTKAIDVPDVTTRLRESRANMVGTLQQFLLAHIMIVEVLMVLPTQVPCDNIFPKRMKQLRNRLPYDMERLNETMWQQQTLKSLAEPMPSGIADDADNELSGEGTPEVVYANLHLTFESRIGEIGAVSVDGVKVKRQHLASHLPPPLKLSEFWRFVTENDVKLIIILQSSDPSNPNCADIMPDDTIVHQMSIIEFIAETNSQNADEDECFKSEKVTLVETSQGNVEPQSVTVLTCRGWARGSNGKLPEPVALVSLWMASERIPRAEGQTLVLCHDGITACGLYLAMSFLLERMAVERECDVISAIRAVRRSRPEFVQSVEQCEYLYDAAETYAKYFERYANFT